LGSDKKKFQVVIDHLYAQINALGVNELEDEAMFRRAEFLTKELEVLKAQEDKILQELNSLAGEIDKSKEKDVQY
jgi:chaperonin cofactor prefoldin